MNHESANASASELLASQSPRHGCLRLLLAPLKVLGHNLLLLALALWQDWSVLVLFWPLWFQSVLLGWYLRDRLGAPPMPTGLQLFRAWFTACWGGFHLMVLMGLTMLSIVAWGRDHDAAVPGRSWVGAIGMIDLLLIVALAVGYWEQHRRRMRSPDSRRARCAQDGVRLLIAPVMRLFPIYMLLVASLNWGEAGVWVFLLAKTIVDLLALPADVLARLSPDAEEPPPVPAVARGS